MKHNFATYIEESPFILRLLLLYLITSASVVAVLIVLGGDQLNVILVTKNLLISIYFAVAFLVSGIFIRKFSSRMLFCFAILATGLFVGSVYLLFVLLFIFAVILFLRFPKGHFPLQPIEYFIFPIFGFLYSLIAIKGMGLGYVNCFVDKTVYLGKGISMDTFYHASWASMISTYDIPSTGLHGTPLLNYHILSHYIYACVSKWLGISILQTYGTTTFVVFIPLLFFVILCLAERITKTDNVRIFFVKLSICFLVFTGFFSYNSNSIFYKFALWDSYLVSESYLMGLILYLSFLTSLVNKNKKTCLVEWSVWLFVLTAVKISIGAMALITLVVCICFNKNISCLLRAKLIGYFTILSGILTTFFSTRLVTKSFTFGSNFIEKYVNYPSTTALDNTLKVIYFLIIHFFYVWIALVLMLLMYRDNNKWDLKTIHYILMFVTIFGVVMIFLAPMYSGEYYFSNVSMFVAVPIIISSANYLLQANGKTFSVNMVSLFFVLCLIGGTAGFLINGISYLNSGISNIRYFAKLDTQNEAAYAPFVRHLNEIRTDSNTQNYLIYIAKDQVDFWVNHNSVRKAPLMIPAISQRAAIFGLPDPVVSNYYYNVHYPKDLFEKGAVSRISKEELLREAKKMGFCGYIDVKRNGWVKVNSVVDEKIKD